MALKFDEYSIRKTAQAVIKLNPHATGFKVEEIIREMKWEAEKCIGDHAGYVGTRGWYMVTFNHPSGGIGCRAMLDPTLVIKD